MGGQTDLQAAANAAAPYAAAAIGKQFGHGANQNETAQAVGHFILGATLAYINGGDPLSGGSSAVAAEKAAQYLAEQYNDGTTAIDPQTGEFSPNLLPEEVKEEITALTGAIAGVVGATGDNGAALNAQIGSVIGQNAVVNNNAVLTNPVVRRVGWSGIQVVGVPILVGIFCSASKQCPSVKDAMADAFEQTSKKVYDALGMTNDSKTGNNKKTNHNVSNTTQAATGSPQIEPPDDKNKNNSKSSGSQAKK